MTSSCRDFMAELYVPVEGTRGQLDGTCLISAPDVSHAISQAREWAATEKAVLYQATHLRVLDGHDVVFDRPLAEFF